MNSNSTITFSTCFYILKCKHDLKYYIQWINNFLSIVNNFNLVIYTDENSQKCIHIPSNINPNRIKIVIKPLEEYHNYKYKDEWIRNHEKNHLLKNMIDWKVNMLWSEKISFVKETFEKQYFNNTDMYGWCDIGYFRNRSDDLNTSFLSNWANQEKINQLDKNKIHYAMVNNDHRFIQMLSTIISDKNQYGLPTKEIPPSQKSVGGNMFILHKDKILDWFNTYDQKLNLYFKHEYLVKDDQLILIDCILSEPNRFHLYKEQSRYDNWFMFQRLLS